MIDLGYYHVFNKSIAGYKIFNNQEEYGRFKLAMCYYRHKDLPMPLSHYLVHMEKVSVSKKNIESSGNKIINILAYCLMPTHIHLIVEPLEETAMATYMNNLQNSYTRFFNLKHKRRGPLWEGPFGRRLIESDEDFLHMTRYVHLNPVTAYLMEKAEQWAFSSYAEYLGWSNEQICNFRDYIDMDAKCYKQFVDDQKNYQRELSKIKKYMFD